MSLLRKIELTQTPLDLLLQRSGHGSCRFCSSKHMATRCDIHAKHALILIFEYCREKMKVAGNVIDELVASSQSDIRQILNMLSTWKLSNSDMSFDEGKTLYVCQTSHCHTKKLNPSLSDITGDKRIPSSRYKRPLVLLLNY